MKVILHDTTITTYALTISAKYAFQKVTSFYLKIIYKQKIKIHKNCFKTLLKILRALDYSPSLYKSNTITELIISDTAEKSNSSKEFVIIL